MTALRGNIRSLRDLKRGLQSLPVAFAKDVARRAAPVLTDETRAAFGSGRTVYGTPRPLSVDGAPLDLMDTGDTRAALAFKSLETIVYAQLGPRYARYLIGRYNILPNGPMPVEWGRKLDAVVRATRGLRP